MHPAPTLAIPSNADRRFAFFASLAAYALALALGAWSIDFGRHWDEVLFVEQVTRTLETGRLLPGRYAYPSLTYWLSLAALLPTALAHGFDRADILAELAGLDPRIPGGAPFLLHARLLAYALAYVAIFWAARLALELSGSRFAALVAGFTLALSFELHYHARWLAPDALVAVFATGATLAAFLWQRDGRRRHFVWAVLAAALAAGSKYPGALALAPVGWAIVSRPGLAFSARARCALGALTLFVLGFLVTTPGALFESADFLKWIEKELLHYSRGHLQYSVMPGADHAARLATYFATQALHAFDPLAVLLFVVAAGGAVHALARAPNRGFLVFLLPWIWVLYFVQQQVMLVRNVLVVLPFLCIFTGVGYAWFERRRALPTRFVALLILASQAAWLVRADASVVRRVRATDEDAGAALQAAHRDAVAHFARETGARIFAAHDLALPTGSEAASGRFVDDLKEADVAIFDSQRVRPHNPLAVVANRPGIYRIVGGPIDVNWNYYPSWSSCGDARPIAVDAAYYTEALARRPAGSKH